MLAGVPKRKSAQRVVKSKHTYLSLASVYHSTVGLATSRRLDRLQTAFRVVERQDHFPKATDPYGTDLAIAHPPVFEALHQVALKVTTEEASGIYSPGASLHRQTGRSPNSDPRSTRHEVRRLALVYSVKGQTIVGLLAVRARTLVRCIRGLVPNANAGNS